jgi:hypothetical protein
MLSGFAHGFGFATLNISTPWTLIYRCPKIGVQTTYYIPYRGCLNAHEKNMEKMFPTKKSVIFIIIINCNTI